MRRGTRRSPGHPPRHPTYARESRRHRRLPIPDRQLATASRRDLDPARRLDELPGDVRRAAGRTAAPAPHARALNQRFIRDDTPGAHRVLKSDGTVGVDRPRRPGRRCAGCSSPRASSSTAAARQPVAPASARPARSRADRSPRHDDPADLRPRGARRPRGRRPLPRPRRRGAGRHRPRLPVQRRRRGGLVAARLPGRRLARRRTAGRPCTAAPAAGGSAWTAANHRLAALRVDRRAASASPGAMPHSTWERCGWTGPPRRRRRAPTRRGSSSAAAARACSSRRRARDGARARRTVSTCPRRAPG